MVDVYIGVIGEPDGVIALEFDSFGDASRFCDELAGHYKEEKKKLYRAIDNSREYEDLDIVFKSDGAMHGEINADVFKDILRLQEGR